VPLRRPLLEVLAHAANLRAPMLLLSSHQLRSRASPERLVDACLGHGDCRGGHDVKPGIHRREIEGATQDGPDV
jgi:hypothetical protein